MGFNALILLKTDISSFIETLYYNILNLIYTVFYNWDNILLLSSPVEFSVLDLFIALTLVGVVIGMFMVFPKRDHFERL